MSIIIPGVELPPIDEYLYLRIDGNGYVSMQISENRYVCGLYDTDKKAVELPPHGRFSIYDGVIVQNDADPTIIPADPEKEDT